MLSWAAFGLRGSGSPPLFYYNTLPQYNQIVYIFRTTLTLLQTGLWNQSPEPMRFWMVCSQSPISLDCGAGTENVGSWSTEYVCPQKKSELYKYYHNFNFL